MQIRSFVFTALLLPMSVGIAAPSPRREAAESENLKLRYTNLAPNWMMDGLPIGNGQMGAMLYGDAQTSRIQFNEESLWLGNEDDTGMYQNFGEITAQFGSGADFSSDREVTSPSGHSSSAAQSVAASCDDQDDTKWCIEHGGRFPIIWQAKTSGKPSAPVTAYTLTSAEDVPDRDPQSWRFLGSMDGVKWTLLDERKNEAVWPQRKMARTFTFPNTTPFTYHRFEFLETHNQAPHFQLAEIALGKVQSAPRNIHRELDLNRAVSRVAYEKDGITYMQESFASFPAKVIVVRFSTNKPGGLSGQLGLKDAHGAPTLATADGMTISGAFPGYKYDGGKEWLPLNREAQVRVLHEGGTVTAWNGRMVVDHADSVTLLLAAGTDFKQGRETNWRGVMPHEAIVARLNAAAKTPYADLLAAHVRDYRNLFARVELDLGGKADPTRSPAERIAQYKEEQPDVGLEEQLFQFGRYLLIASSREGGLPANLQGKWNNSNNPPWRCDYHTDVNVEMNYWLADETNLGECFQPFAEWIHSIRPARLEATRKAYGTRGWITRGESGLFGGATWDWTPGTSAWMMQNCFDHYAFTKDKEYLRTRAYPAMKEVCEFWLDRLKELPDGTLVARDGFSPEHGPKEDGVSFEQQLIWDLFSNSIEAADVLGVDKAFRDELFAKREKLLKPRIGKWGQLQEWMTDRDNPKDTHRHLSHLIAVYPSRQITPRGTPELAKAAGISLAARGDDSTGWSSAWKINLWARLHDGDHAHRIFKYLLRPCTVATMQNEGGGLYGNLLDACPPFQIDGNFGYAAGVCEMLLQSHTDEIELLPALPKAWPTGKVRGLRARGGVTVDIAWKDGQVTACHLVSPTPQPVKVRMNGEVKTVMTEAGN
ncbi:MAG: glycoside hydrolase N-terminal domain-containing protein [Luteolibacter sp.]